MVTITGDKYVPWREGLIPHTQDMLFWSFWASTTTPLLAENEDVNEFFLSTDKPTTIVQGDRLPMGKRKNPMVMNAKKQRAEHLLEMHKQQTPNNDLVNHNLPLSKDDSYAVIPNHHRIADLTNNAPILKSFYKPSAILTDQPSTTTAHANLAATLIYARDELWVEHEGFDSDEKACQWATIESKRGTAVIAAGDWLSISGSEKFKLAQWTEKRDLLVTQAQVQETYNHIHQIKGYQIQQYFTRDIRLVIKSQ